MSSQEDDFDDFKQPAFIQVDALAINRDGTKIAVASSQHLESEMTYQNILLNIVDATTLQGVRTLFRQMSETTPSIDYLKWSVSGDRLFVGDVTGKIRWYDTTSSEVAQTYTTHSLRSLDFNPDQTLVASVDWEYQLQIFDPLTGETLRSVDLSAIDDRWFINVCWSPDGTTLATTGYSETVRIWDAASLQQINEFKFRAQLGAHSAVWSPDSKQLAIGGTNHRITLWNAAAGELIQTLPMNGKPPLIWDSVTNYLISRRDTEIVLWDALNNVLVAEIPIDVPHLLLTNMSLCTDRKWLVYGGYREIAGIDSSILPDLHRITVPNR